MKNLPILCALDNRGVPGMDHCFGAPFIAKDFATAMEMVKEALGDKKDLVNLKDFYLVELLPYDITREFPLVFENTDEFPDIICVAELFEDEENSVDEVAYCGRYVGVNYSEQVGEEMEVADEQE